MNTTSRHQTSIFGGLVAALAGSILATTVFADTQPGLRQEWIRATNPGSRDGIIALFETEELLVPPFHASAGTSWWTGNQTPGWDVPQYPAEVIDALDSRSDNNDYIVRSTGEVFIPESGAYRFSDGNDDYTFWAIDLDRSGEAGDDFDEVIIDDNVWTNLQRDANNGGEGLGEVDIDVAPGGEWLAIEFLLGEFNGTDAGVIYWDYGTAGGGVGAVAGFPDFPEEAIDLAEAENWLIPDSHLRSSAGPVSNGPANFVAGFARIGESTLQGAIVNEVVAGGGGKLPGLLQEWIRQPNPGNRDAIVNLIENGDLIVPAFHSSDGTSWWTGNQAPGWNVPQYPSDVVDQLDNANDNNDYVVRLTGELFIPESGLYVFADGNDDFTYWAVDSDRSGVAGDSPEEVLINDNVWTNLQRDANNGGQGLGEVDIEVAPGGDWIAVEFLMGEGVGTDAGVMYWDYGADGGGLNAADDFPQFPDDPIFDLFEAELWLIPDSHLRARSAGDLVSAQLIGKLSDSDPYEFDVDGVAGTNDRIVMSNRDPNVLTTIADVDGATLRINATGPILIGDAFDILDADQIVGTPLVVSSDPTQDWTFNNETGEVILSGIGGAAGLRAGDADQDLDFDQLDLVAVQIAGKYLTGSTATWGEGDWNGAPGGSQGSPPAGDGRFNQLDIISALGASTYLTGPYAALRSGGAAEDGQTSIIYNASTGELAVDAPAGMQLTSINIDSAGGVFTGTAAQNLGGSFDNDADNNIFKATFGTSFGSLSLGRVAQVGLSEAFVLNDFTVVGSLAGGGDLGEVDLIYVPEPCAIVIAIFGLLGFISWATGRK